MKSEHLFPPGYLTQDSLRGFLNANMKPFSELSFEELLEEGHAIVGSPETVRGQLAEMQDNLGFGTLCALLHFGDMPHEHTVRNMEFLASEIIPTFRDREPEPVELSGAV